jgi:hypothetical protein
MHDHHLIYIIKFLLKETLEPRTKTTKGSTIQTSLYIKILYLCKNLEEIVVRILPLLKSKYKNHWPHASLHMIFIKVFRVMRNFTSCFRMMAKARSGNGAEIDHQLVLHPLTEGMPPSWGFYATLN